MTVLMMIITNDASVLKLIVYVEDYLYTINMNDNLEVRVAVVMMYYFVLVRNVFCHLATLNDMDFEVEEEEEPVDEDLLVNGLILLENLRRLRNWG